MKQMGACMGTMGEGRLLDGPNGHVRDGEDDGADGRDAEAHVGHDGDAEVTPRVGALRPRMPHTSRCVIRASGIASSRRISNSTALPCRISVHDEDVLLTVMAEAGEA